MVLVVVVVKGWRRGYSSGGGGCYDGVMVCNEVL